MSCSWDFWFPRQNWPRNRDTATCPVGSMRPPEPSKATSGPATNRSAPNPNARANSTEAARALLQIGEREPAHVRANASYLCALVRMGQTTTQRLRRIAWRPSIVHATPHSRPRELPSIGVAHRSAWAEEHASPFAHTRPARGARTAVGPQNALKVMIVLVSKMPLMAWTFSLTKWPMSASRST